jgi:hypothetical protein
MANHHCGKLATTSTANGNILLLFKALSDQSLIKKTLTPQ